MRLEGRYHRANLASAMMDGAPPRYLVFAAGTVRADWTAWRYRPCEQKLAGVVGLSGLHAPQPQPRERCRPCCGAPTSTRKPSRICARLSTVCAKCLARTLSRATARSWLNAAVVRCDVGRFETLVREGSRDALSAAADLYRGPLIDDVAISEEGWNEWLTGERERLLELALGAMVGLGEQELAAGRAEHALKPASALSRSTTCARTPTG